MILQRQTNSIISKSDAAEVLRSQYSPSQITGKFPTGLQSIIMAACPTVDCCEKVDSPMLGTMAQAYPVFYDNEGKKIDITLSWMKGHFTEVSAFANVKEKMNDWQLENLCLQILVDYPTLTLMEFILFCARLRSGIYEDFYGSIDPMRIMKSFRQFIDDRGHDQWRKREREEQERREREYEESRKTAVTWQEYCKMNGIEGRTTLFDRPKEEQAEAKEVKYKEPIDAILNTAHWVMSKEKDSKEYFLVYVNTFKRKYGCTPAEFIEENEVQKGKK